MKYAVVVLAALVLVLGSHVLTKADAPSGVQKWEYRLCAMKVGAGRSALMNTLETELASLVSTLGIERVELDHFRKFLTDAGAGGWEIVKADEELWIFKRPLK